jgi:hypothetical protein
MKNTMSEATKQRMKDAAEQVLTLLIDDLGIEPFQFTCEPGDSFSAVDVLAESMVLAVLAGMSKAGVPIPQLPPKSEIGRICGQMFVQHDAH